MNDDEAAASPAGDEPAPRRLRVLEVVGNAIVGGMETWVLRTLAALPRERFEFSALCPFESRFTEALRTLGVDVLVAQMPEDPPWSTILAAASLTQASRIDVLHAHLPRAHLLAGLVGRLTHRPVATTIHGQHVTSLDLEVHRLVHSHVSVVCRATYYQALGLGVSPSRLSCEPNGVDTEAFSPRARGESRLRASLGLPEDAPLVGFVGRLSPEKGPEVALRTAMMLRGRCPSAHVVMVGEGPMLAGLQDGAARLNVRDSVHFVGLRHDMPALYAEFDALLCSSHSEAMPLTVLEAMASGLPVVATRVGGVPDLVAHGLTGALVAAGDFQDMAAQLARLLDDAGLRREYGQAARERAQRRFSLAQAAPRAGAMLERVAAAADGSAQRGGARPVPIGIGSAQPRRG